MTIFDPNIRSYASEYISKHPKISQNVIFDHLANNTTNWYGINMLINWTDPAEVELLTARLGLIEGPHVADDAGRPSPEPVGPRGGRRDTQLGLHLQRSEPLPPSLDGRDSDGSDGGAPETHPEGASRGGGRRRATQHAHVKQVDGQK